MSDQNRTLFLHIGWHKTGTSAIQAMLRENREALEQKIKIYYPRTGQRGNAHHPLSHSLLDSDSNDASLWMELNSELRDDTEWKTSIVSSESLHDASEDHVKIISSALAGDWDVRAICYLRQPDEYLEAAFAEHVKGGQYRNSWKEYLLNAQKKGSPNYRPAILRWRKYLGDNAVLIRPYDKKVWKNENLFADFFTSIGHDNTETINDFINPGLVNQRPDATTLSVIREISRKLVAAEIKYSGPFLRKHLCKPIQKHLNEAGSFRPPASFFTVQEREEFRNRYRSFFDKVDLKFTSSNVPGDGSELADLLEYEDLPSGEKEEVLMAGVIELLTELTSVHQERIMRKLEGKQHITTVK